MKVLVGSNRLGPAAVFLPDGTHAAAPAAEALIAPLVAQAQARGSEATFDAHAKVLSQGDGYAGRWHTEEMPDGISAVQALHYARYRSVTEARSDRG